MENHQYGWSGQLPFLRSPPPGLSLEVRQSECEVIEDDIRTEPSRVSNNSVLLCTSYGMWLFVYRCNLYQQPPYSVLLYVAGER